MKIPGVISYNNLELDFTILNNYTRPLIYIQSKACLQNNHNEYSIETSK